MNMNMNKSSISNKQEGARTSLLTSTFESFQLLNLLKSKINTHFASYQEKFLHLDDNRDGIITIDELLEYSQKNRIITSNDEYNNFKNTLLLTNAINMDYISFVNWLRYDHTPLNTNITTDAALKKLMEYLFNDTKEAKEKFKELYKDKADKGITIAELDKVLTTLKLAIPKNILEKLTKRFEANGHFNWESFLKFIREFVPDTPHKDDYATGLTAHEFKILGELLEIFQTNFNSLRSAFAKFDSNKDGTLSHQEFKNAIESVGIKHIVDKEIRDIFDFFDTNRDDKIAYKEFLQTVNHKFLV